MSADWSHPEPAEFVVLGWNGDLPAIGETVTMPGLFAVNVFTVQDRRTLADGRGQVRLVHTPDTTPTDADWREPAPDAISTELDRIVDDILERHTQQEDHDAQ